MISLTQVMIKAIYILFKLAKWSRPCTKYSFL